MAQPLPRPDKYEFGSAANPIDRYSIREAVNTGLRAGLLSAQANLIERSVILRNIPGMGILKERAEFKRSEMLDRRGRDPATGRKLSSEEIKERDARRKYYTSTGEVLADIQENVQIIADAIVGRGIGGVGGGQDKLRAGASGKQKVIESRGGGTYEVMKEELINEKEREDDKDQDRFSKRLEDFLTKLFGKKKDDDAGIFSLLSGLLGGLGLSIPSLSFGGLVGSPLAMLRGKGKLPKGGAKGGTPKPTAKGGLSSGKQGPTVKPSWTTRPYALEGEEGVFKQFIKGTGKTIAKNALRAMPIITAALTTGMLAYDINNIKADDTLSDAEKKALIGKVISGAIGSIVGTVGGAAAGSAIAPGLGTFVGSLGGAVVGQMIGESLAESPESATDVYDIARSVPGLGEFIDVNKTTEPKPTGEYREMSGDRPPVAPTPPTASYEETMQPQPTILETPKNRTTPRRTMTVWEGEAAREGMVEISPGVWISPKTTNRPTENTLVVPAREGGSTKLLNDNLGEMQRQIFEEEMDRRDRIRKGELPIPQTAPINNTNINQNSTTMLAPNAIRTGDDIPRFYNNAALGFA
jgi:hypothetical protein